MKPPSACESLTTSLEVLATRCQQCTYHRGVRLGCTASRALCGGSCRACDEHPAEVRRDGRVAQSLIPPTDVRIPYAMETHGVEASLLQSQPTQASNQLLWYIPTELS